MPRVDVDRVGLNPTPIRDAPIVRSREHAADLARSSGDAGLAIAGLRHSQGGHTSVAHGRILQTTTALNRVSQPWASGVPGYDALIDVEAGATWDDVQRALGYYGFAPLVQQSSAHFSIGGSLSVNCHGRDPRLGPLSSSVESLTVLTGGGDVLRASRTENPDLFAACLGGYGGCGMILGARLRATANRTLEYVGGTGDRSLEAYVEHLAGLDSSAGVHLHYAWMCCVRDAFYRQVVIADLVHVPNPQEFVPQQQFKEQEWGDDELLRAGWSAARRDQRMRKRVWDELVRWHREGDDARVRTATRNDWLRAPVSFTEYVGAQTTDILQEYFVPRDRLEPMVESLRALFTASAAWVNVLSTTLRLVRSDNETVLSYCPGEARVCIAVDAEVRTVGDAPARRDLDPRVKETLRTAIGHALELGGSYYLPYFRVADRATFERAYPGHARMQQAIDRYNPKVGGRRRYWNGFLQACFD